MKMEAMVLERPREPLRLREVEQPRPAEGELLVRVLACAVCRTDLHVVDGDLPTPKLPLIPGHQVVGVIVERGSGVDDFTVGQRVGIPWLAQTCGHCRYCRSGLENLCDEAVFTGYTRDGGYAEFATARAAYCFGLDSPRPARLEEAEFAPLLCAGLIGYRALRKAGPAESVRTVGLYGFGSSAHLVAQAAIFEGREIFAFTRPGDKAGQEDARNLGVAWAGGSDETPPRPLDAAILFAPEGKLVPPALRHIRKGGSVVCAGIHMSDIPSFPYVILWGERSLCSVANLTRQDGVEFLALARRAGIRASVECFPLHKANEALERLRRGALHGRTAVLLPGWNGEPGS